MLKYLSHAIVVTCIAFIVFFVFVMLYSELSIEEYQKYLKTIIVFIAVISIVVLFRQYRENIFRRRIGVILLFYRNGIIYALKHVDAREIVDCAETEFKMIYRFDISNPSKFFIHLTYKSGDEILEEKLPLKFACGILGEAIRIIEQNRKDIRIVRDMHELLVLAEKSGQSNSSLIRNYILSQM